MTEPTRPIPRGIRFPDEISTEIEQYATRTGISFTAAVLVLCRDALDAKTRMSKPAEDAEK